MRQTILWINHNLVKYWSEQKDILPLIFFSVSKLSSALITAFLYLVVIQIRTVENTTQRDTKLQSKPGKVLRLLDPLDAY